MFNLDGENSLKTMHEKNDGVEEEVIELSSDDGDEVMGDAEELQEEVDGDEAAPVDQQSGNTPVSGTVRFSEERVDDDASAGSEASSEIMENPMTRGTASEAVESQTSPETGVSG